MNFDEWWEKNTRSFLHNEGIAKMTARAGWEAGVAEGLRRAQVARSDTAQGGGSQAASTEAQGDGVTVQGALEAAGGNPGIKTRKAEMTFEEWFIDKVGVAPVPGSFVGEAWNAALEAAADISRHCYIEDYDILALKTPLNTSTNAYKRLGSGKRS